MATATKRTGDRVVTRPPARKKPTDRKPRARATEFEPAFEPLDLDAMPQTIDVETVHLFTLNETDYYVPLEPPARVSLKYLRMAREDAAGAQGWLLEQLLGEDAYTALMEWEGLTTDILVRLLNVVHKLAIDATEGVKGPLGRG